MLLEALFAIATVMPDFEAGTQALRTRAASPSTSSVLSAGPAPAIPYFSATARAVSNWRNEAGAALVPTSLALVVKYAESDPAFVARCVKLNNYWCIKQARWAGELGGDAEGHTGFATAADGADAAAQLLRRYYREFGRRSAISIVRRWAPAECGLPRPIAASRPIGRMTVPPVSRAVAPYGIGNTLRARFLARRGPGAAPRSAALARSGSGAGLRVQPWSARARLAGNPSRVPRSAPPPLPALKPVTDVATGVGLPPVATAPKPLVSQAPAVRPKRTIPAATMAAAAPPQKPPPSKGAADPSSLLSPARLVAESSALPSIVGRFPGGNPYDLPSTLAALRGSLLNLQVPPMLCGSDEVRIRNYANRIAGSVGLNADDDLRLFEADGTPTERLAPVMLAMSAVELGSLRAAPFLVATAIERLGKGVTGAAASAD